MMYAFLLKKYLQFKERILKLKMRVKAVILKKN